MTTQYSTHKPSYRDHYEGICPTINTANARCQGVDSQTLDVGTQIMEANEAVCVFDVDVAVLRCTQLRPVNFSFHLNVDIP